MPLYAYKGVRPRLGRNVYVAPSATVIGDVEIGDDSSVWFGAILRGDVGPIRIGARSNIQDNAVVHVTNGKPSGTTVGDEVTVGHLALLHGCTIGSRSLVGMSSVVLDDAVLEDECLVAAGALVTLGARVRSRSLVVGRPAKRVRDLELADLEAIGQYASRYVQYARDFGRELELV